MTKVYKEKERVQAEVTHLNATLTAVREESRLKEEEHQEKLRMQEEEHEEALRAAAADRERAVAEAQAKERAEFEAQMKHLKEQLARYEQPTGFRGTTVAPQA
jgi:hypothetical protein